MKPAVSQYICLGCEQAINVGEMVLNEWSEGGYIHADCCSSDRASYCDADGEPIGDDEPLPTPFPFHTDMERLA
ncbi:hypothetical protein ACFSE0_10670 [Ochrobactrum teleogrylli]|uniref:Uncharacterized protein n=1 Tax=Ochrobactrum teleogrylli TaxID=2479765 RepID=A0ABY2YAJ7_9HYPH|nr:hypothetical protein [[Ochrobactrum] teleogrylli]TNV17758.1 hypothetical protein FIC94_06175 [[Ochrobactrum] teleogrylli]